MISNIKDKLNKTNDNVIEQFISLLELPDDEFEKIYPDLKKALDEAFASNATRQTIKENMKGMRPINIKEEKEQIKSMLDEIEEENMSDHKKEILKMMFLKSIDVTEDIINNPRDIVTVKVKRESSDVKLPVYAHPSDAGADVYTLEDVELAPKETKIIKTGLFVEIPIGYYISIVPRSGMSLKTDLRIANTPATLDSAYRGEVGIIANNIGDSPMTITKGTRIAQMLIHQTPMIEWEEVDALSESDRGIGGYGSSGQS